MQLSVQRITNFDNLTPEVHRVMDKIIQKKLCLSKLPEEELQFE